MSKKTDLLNKKAFISLVIVKLLNKKEEHIVGLIQGKKTDLDKQYKLAQRYARECLKVKLKEPSVKESTDKFYSVLGCLTSLIETVVRKNNKTPEEYATVDWVENVLSRVEELVNIKDSSLRWQKTNEYANKLINAESITEAEAEAPIGITEAEAEASIEPATPTSKVPVVAPAIEEPYLQVVTWLRAIDKGTVNGTVQEAKQFINTLDDYTDKLQGLLVEQAKAQLKNLLRQVKDCEAVLDRSEVENIWLEVGTETGGELMVTPYSRESSRETTQLVPLNTCGL